MSATMHVDVVSAEESIFGGEAEFVVLPGEAGELGIYPRHAPLITRIKPGVVRIRVVGGGGEEQVFVAGGILEVQPHVVTLVPEKRQELTTEGGLEVAGNRAALAEYLLALKAAGLRVSLFVDPVDPQIQAAKEVGAEWVELHAGTYAESSTRAEATRLFQELVNAARHARSLGLKVKCGHGLNYRNIKPFRGREEFAEYSIGHAIIARAVLVGIERAVREMIALIGG